MAEGIKTISQVVENNLCIGCGNCAYFAPQNIKVAYNNEHGAYLAHGNLQSIMIDNTTAIETSCPFSNTAENEDMLARKRFNLDELRYNKFTGYYKGLYAGRITNQQERFKSSSGGLTSWMLSQLLDRKLVEGVVVVADSRTNTNKEINPHPMYSYQIVTTSDKLAGSRKSKYYPITLAEIYSEIRNFPGRVAVVGIPCMIKAIQLAANQDKVLRKKVEFYLGIVCGHLKTTGFSDFIAASLAINPRDMRGIDFRVKNIKQNASDYDVEITYFDHKLQEISTKTERNYSIDNIDWGIGLFKNPACEFCDDVFAECADITFGDAWLPRYINDSLGTNVIISRSSILDMILKEGIEQKQIHIDKLSLLECIRSQFSGLKHRRLGLAIRLWDLRSRGIYLKKRVRPYRSLLASSKYKMLISKRNEIAQYCFQHQRNIINLNAAKQASGEVLRLRELLADYKFIKSSSRGFSKIPVVNKILRILQILIVLP